MKKLLFYIFLICTFASCSESSLQDANKHDWTIFRGSPSLCGYTENRLSDNPQMIWSTTTKTRTVSAPIVFNNVVYTLSKKGELRGYTLEGDSCAYYNFDTTVEAPFTVSNGILYVGRIDGFVTALDISDPSNLISQQHLWDYETEGQISGSPNLVGGNLLVGSYDNFMYTFDAKTGAKLSQYETGYYINGAAAVWDKYMVFGGCDAWVRIVDTTNGEVTESLKLDSYVPASPAIYKGDVTICDYNGNVYEMNLDKGKIASSRKLVEVIKGEDNETEGSVAMPTVTKDAVYILSGDRYLARIDKKDGAVKYKKMLRGQTGECSPIVARDKVLVCTKDGHVSIFNADDGAEIWHYEVGEQIIASPAVIDDRFFILTSRGTLLCFK